MILDQAIDFALRQPRVIKRGIALALDAALCVLCVWLAFLLRLGELVPLSGPQWPAAVAAPLIALPVFTAFGLYRAVFRYLGSEAIAAIAGAVIIYGIIYSAIFAMFGIEGVPRTVGIIQPGLMFIFVSASRAFGRFFLGGAYRDSLRATVRQDVIIYGAGASGRQLADAIAGSRQMRVRGFVDDDSAIQGRVIAGRPVWSPAALGDLIESYDVAQVLLAMPSATRERRNEVLERLRQLGVQVRTLPGILDLAHGRVTVTDLRAPEADDLLGRPPVAPDTELLVRNIKGMTVLVTGAGGSIGSELCRQILAHEPARLILVDMNEYALYAIHRELARAAEEHGNSQVIPMLGSACDEVRMRAILERWQPSTVYHAAAYKHVPLVEHNIVDGVRNNVLGTWVCARLARSCGVKHFVLVSTDKAVRPTNVMGASKRAAEMLLQALAADADDVIYAMVRFGNVLGSSGSVVPLFNQQISAGGPVTVTHREVTRYFMTIPEASQLVLQAGAMARGGEVFVLDMGTPVKIADLARRMIELSGLRVREPGSDDGDIEINFVGLRHGEKLYEELLIGENPLPTAHPRIMMANEAFLPLAQLAKRITTLQGKVAVQDPVGVREWLIELVDGYVPAEEIVDPLV